MREKHLLLGPANIGTTTDESSVFQRIFSDAGGVLHDRGTAHNYDLPDYILTRNLCHPRMYASDNLTAHIYFITRSKKTTCPCK